MQRAPLHRWTSNAAGHHAASSTGTTIMSAPARYDGVHRPLHPDARSSSGPEETTDR